MTDIRLPERILTDRRFTRLPAAAFAAYVMASAWSVSNKTDGHIESAELSFIPRLTLGHAEKLVEAGLFEIVEDGWMITDFLRWQVSKDELDRLENIRRREAEKKARQREKARLIAVDEEDGVPQSSGQSRGTVTGDSTGQDRTGLKELYENTISPFCSEHPGGIKKPCTECMNARLRFEHAELVRKSAPTVPGIVTEPDCPKHPYWPKRDCARCREEAVA